MLMTNAVHFFCCGRFARARSIAPPLHRHTLSNHPNVRPRTNSKVVAGVVLLARACVSAFTSLMRDQIKAPIGISIELLTQRKG